MTIGLLLLQEAERDMTPWLWANFAILVLALGYLSKKYGGPFLKASAGRDFEGDRGR